MLITYDSRQAADYYRNYIRRRYGSSYEAWNDHFKNFVDDRERFCYKYESIMEAIDAMESVTNSFVWNAFKVAFGEADDWLDEIQDLQRERSIPARI